MNLYIHIEISAREEDSSLLKAVLAAHNGFEVLIGVSNIFNFLFKRKFLNRGIFHTKSLEHNSWKEKFLKMIQSQGNKITSLDEEAGIIKDKKSLEIFLKSRFTIVSLERASKVFCWGDDDYKMLKKLFPKFANKFILNGSSRVDMWREKFKKYWLKNDNEKINKILISLNFPIINGYLSYETIIRNLETAGYFDRSKNLRNELNDLYEIKKINYEHFKKMISFLARKLPNEEFIVRPHPVEKIDTWSKLLSDHKNIEVNNSGNFNEQLYKSKILIHNSCTTAFQGLLANKKVICYNPSNLDNEHGRIANKLGKMVFSVEELAEEIRSFDFEKNKIKKIDNDILKKKLFFTNSDKLSSNLIMENWIKEVKKIKFKKNNYLLIRICTFIYNLSSFLRNFFTRSNFKNHKFNNFNQTKLQDKVIRIEKILKLKNKSKVVKLSKNCILIKNEM